MRSMVVGAPRTLHERNAPPPHFVRSPSPASLRYAGEDNSHDK